MATRSPAGWMLRACAGAAVYGLGVGIAYEVLQPKPPLPSAAQRCCTFEKMAPEYDTEVERDEASSGILRLREELASRARGRVLEVAAGTGRNLPFYSGTQVKELMVGDFSESMLKVAARKVAELQGKAEGHCPSAVTLAVVDAAALPFADSSYDTVVDSFGLCSFEEPGQALKEMS